MKTLQQWDASANWYDQNMGEEGDSLNKDTIRPLIFKMVGDISNKTILDSGCGSGYVTAELAKTSKKVIGSDFSQHFIDMCKKKYNKVKNLDFIQHDITEKMQFESNAFNIILSKMVLQYVSELKTFANESYRVLDKNGELIVIVDHPFNTQFYYAQQVVGKPNQRYGVLNDYFSHTTHTKLSLWNKVMLTWYPKTVGDYINPFVKAGYRLSDLEELPEEKNGTKIPRILGIKFKK